MGAAQGGVQYARNRGVAPEILHLCFLLMTFKLFSTVPSGYIETFNFYFIFWIVFIVCYICLSAPRLWIWISDLILFKWTFILYMLMFICKVSRSWSELKTTWLVAMTSGFHGDFSLTVWLLKFCSIYIFVSNRQICISKLNLLWHIQSKVCYCENEFLSPFLSHIALGYNSYLFLLIYMVYKQFF